MDSVFKKRPNREQESKEGSWEAVKETYQNLPAHERDEFNDQLLGVAKLFGMGEDTEAKLRNILSPTPSSPVAEKARALAKLDTDFAQAIAEHYDNPQRVKDLKRIYDEERGKIVGS